jgi:hypothetical protein
MSTGKQKNPSPRRVFRRHKGLALFLPGSLWFALFGLICAAALYLARYSKWALWVLLLAAIPVFKLLQLYLTWLSYSVVFVPRDKVLVERLGLVGVSERRIPLSDFSTFECERPWWARLLGIDVGDATLGVIGGPFTLQHMGNFGELWALVESKGQPVAVWTQPAQRQPPRPAPRSTELAPVTAKAAKPRRTNGGQSHAALTHTLAPVDSYVYKGMAFSPSAISYAGFCAFCQQFVLFDRDWSIAHCRVPNPDRFYYRDGISASIAGSYLLTLREACILIPGPNGHSRERVSCRIHSIQEIQELVPDISTLMVTGAHWHPELIL